MSDSRERFMHLLKSEILQLDQPDLDFGIYRILNFRRAEIERFFDVELPKVLEDAVGKEGAERRAELQALVAGLREKLGESARSLGLSSAFRGEELQETLASSPLGEEYQQALAALEVFDDASPFAESELDRLYNHLYVFFSRYYRDGDFESQPRRAREARYSVPYNGEDVHFYWRSFGSHYVKTAEELRSYQFNAERQRVRFELVEAYQEADNVKGTTRYFVPLAEGCEQRAEPGGPVFVVPFAFHRLTGEEDKKFKERSDEQDASTTQERIVADAVKRVDVPKGIAKADLLRHMRRYTAKARRDYFVHPKLGPFLLGELDYFLKHEILDIDGLTFAASLADRLGKVRVFHEVGSRIIAFLEDIEAIQVQLFEKRRFVMRADYLVSARLIDKSLWDLVLSNEKQLEQWREECGLKGKIGWSTLESHPSLVVDTSLYEPSDVRELLARLDNLAELTDGVLVYAENFGALRTLQPSFRQRIGAMYIDPPYNTGSDDFIYKDEFSRHSTWLTMMRERMLEALPMLASDAALGVSIDENELTQLSALLKGVVGQFVGTVAVQTNPKGRVLDKSLATSHDYLLLCGRSQGLVLAGLPKTAEELARDFPEVDEDGVRYRELELRNTHREFNSETRPNLWYPFYVEENSGRVEVKSFAGSMEVWPLWPDGFRGCWTG